MVDNLIQCCYTNDDGWKSVAVSEGIQKSAYSFCTRFQVVNSDIPTDGWKTESGDDLDLFEVHGDNAFVYLCRTKYGLTDRVGRRNMFSHAFILPWSEALRDPNAFLTIANENFAADLETAEERHEGVYLPPFTLGAALRDLGMDQAAYLALIRAVYVQLAENKSPDPLYIGCDGNDRQMRELLYCIYVGLPYHLRKQLNAASAATKAPERMQLIFSADAASQRRYFIPRTGEENVLTQKLVSRIERGGYIDHAPLLLQEELDAPGAFLRYFDELASRAAALGDEGGKNDLTLRIAYQLMLNANLESMSGPDLDFRLTEALRAKPRANSQLDDYITGLLREMTKRGMTLAQGASELLKLRLDDAACPAELTDAADEYYVALLAKEPPPEAAEQLSLMPETLSKRYSGVLRKTERGREILALYYSDAVYRGKELNWTLLQSIREMSDDCGVREQVGDSLADHAWELYTGALNGGGVQSELAQYESLMANILPREKMPECIVSAKEKYWESIKFSNYSLDKHDEYDAMRTKYVRCKMFLDYEALLTAQLKGEVERRRFLSDTVLFFSSRKYAEELESFEQDELDYAVKELIKAAEEHQTGKSVRFFPKWVELAARLGVADKDEKPLIALYDAVNNAQNGRSNVFYEACEKLCAATEQFIKNSGGFGVSPSSDELLKDALELVKEECIQSDREGRPITLDVWITLGSLLNGNSDCFSIFKTVKPCILELEPDVVARQSKRFRGSLSAAQSYVEQKGDEAKAVKRWIKAGEKADRKSKNPLASVASYISDRADRLNQWFEDAAPTPSKSSPKNAPSKGKTPPNGKKIPKSGGR